MVGRFRSTRIVLFCAVVAILLPHCVGLTCCMDSKCEKTKTCEEEERLCKALLPSEYGCAFGPTDGIPRTCEDVPSNQDCVCTRDRCNVPGGAPSSPPPPQGGAAPPPGGAAPPQGGAPPLPAPPPPAPKSSANPMMLNIELLLAAAVIKLFKFVL